ncbi:hypothetical protein JCM8097_004369 [Rhodosporidiobolus ruineniae]
MPVPFGQQVPTPKTTTVLNGTLEQKIDRFTIAELIQGWPCHRDAWNWKHFRDMFTNDAQLFTTWSAGKSIDGFIEVSQKGFANGDRIMHKCLGTTVEVNATGQRGIGIVKTEITQRFESEAEGGGTCEVDVECQNRFVFFVEKQANGDWKTAYYKVFYEKDKVIPVDPRRIPKSAVRWQINDDKLQTFPYGYRYLGYYQSLRGHAVKLDLPLADGEEHDRMYQAMCAWTDDEADRKTMDGLLGVERQ